jgi:hypothetical protein
MATENAQGAALRAAVLAEVEAAAECNGKPECERHADAILAIFAAAQAGCGARPYPAGSEGDDGTECVLPAGHAGPHDDDPELSAGSIREALAAERALATLAAERNQYRIALERIADGSRNRDGMMGCASRALAEHPEPQPAPELTPVEAVRVAVAEEWQPRVDALRALVAEMLGTYVDTGRGHLSRVSGTRKAEWRKRAGLPS